MESIRQGVIIGHPDEQFLQFWMAIEILAEGAKDPVLVAVTARPAATPCTAPGATERRSGARSRRKQYAT